jgi:hypothetical protein
MELNSELTAEVQAAIVATERLVIRVVEDGGTGLLPLLAQVRALAARPVSAKFPKALDDLKDAFPYWQDSGARAVWLASHPR